MPSRTTRVRLSAGQKMVLCRYRSAHPELPLRALAAWISKEFELQKPPSHAAVLAILRHPLAEEDVLSKPALKTNQRVSCLTLERELIRWIERCEELKMPAVMWATIRAKAEKIRRALARDAAYASNSKLERMMFSDGWIQKLQQRHGLKPRRLHEEATSACTADVEQGRAALQHVTCNKDLRDIFNMDESALFYCAPLSTSVSRSSIVGRKKSKKRLTVAITTNADSSSKVPLFFVDTARRPRCFGGRTTAELGINYANAAKGWMTAHLFCNWLSDFNDAMYNEQRHVLLLLDNASPHRVSERYSNVTPHFLPPNTTAHLQPQNAGVIQSFKSQFNKNRNEEVVEKLDEMLEQVKDDGEEHLEKSAEQLYNVNILAAMRWAAKAWNAVSCDTVVSCWRHMGIIAADFHEFVGTMDKLRIGPPSIRQLTQ